MPTFKLRTANIDDREFAYAAKRAAMKDYVEAVWVWNESDQRLRFDRRFNEAEIQVISVSGTDVGILDTEVTSDHFHLHGLFLLPEHQNKRIGRSVVSKIFEEASALNLPVRLQCLKQNPRAVRFYSLLGFRQSGETEYHWIFETEPNAQTTGE